MNVEETVQTWLWTDFVPQVRQLARTADDLATASSHYLVNRPKDHSELKIQFNNLSQVVRPYSKSWDEFFGAKASYAVQLASLASSHPELFQVATMVLQSAEAAFPRLPDFAYGQDRRVDDQHDSLRSTWLGFRNQLDSSLPPLRKNLARLDRQLQVSAGLGDLQCNER